jgi:hypothetical protein
LPCHHDFRIILSDVENSWLLKNLSGAAPLNCTVVAYVAIVIFRVEEARKLRRKIGVCPGLAGSNNAFNKPACFFKTIVINLVKCSLHGMLGKPSIAIDTVYLVSENLEIIFTRHTHLVAVAHF